MRKLIVLSFLLSPLVGCGDGELRVDSTTDATSRASLKAIEAQLTPEENSEFQRDIFVLMLEPTLQAKWQRGIILSDAEMTKPLHGLTVKEIHAKAQDCRVRGKAEALKADEEFKRDHPELIRP